MAKIEEIFKTDIKHNGDYSRTASGNLEKITGIENAIQQLFHRLLTEKGSIVHRPNYGVGVKRFQNATMSISKQRELALEVQDQFEQDERVEKFLGLSISTDDFEPDKITIICRVELVGYGETELKFTPFEA